MTTVLSLPQLNRALLARQMLLAREQVPLVKAIDRLVGLQAQVPRAPFISLWSRLEKFRRADLVRLIEERKVIRATMMRGTIHLLSRKDFIAFRNLIQPVLTQVALNTPELRKTRHVEAWLEHGRNILGESPMTFDAFRKVLKLRAPGLDAAAVSRAVQHFVPLVRVPDGSPWSFKANAAFFPAERWLEEPLEPHSPVTELILRYLAAFGPATVADAQTWSGLRTLKPVFEELRPRLATFRDEKGRELFDLKRAPRPPGDTPAPVRFLPDFDNLILSHADRSRVIAKSHRDNLKSPNGIGVPTFLVDGIIAGRWKIVRDKTWAVLEMKGFGKVLSSARDALEAEGADLVAFVEPEAKNREVRFAR
jgi:hypothetical protein